MNLSLYSVNAFLILDTEGHRVLAKYYRPKSHPQGEPKGLLTLKEQRAFEKGLWQKTKKAGGACLLLRLIVDFGATTLFSCAGDIILFDSHLAVYKHSLDLVFYLIGGPSENELMLHSALIAFSDAVHMLLRNAVEKRAVLENLDLVLLCLDETIDDGCVFSSFLWTQILAHSDWVQDHRGDGFDNNCFKSEQTKSGYDGDHH